MGLLDVFKKKKDVFTDSSGSSLNNLPPIPQNPRLPQEINGKIPSPDDFDELNNPFPSLDADPVLDSLPSELPLNDLETLSPSEELNSDLEIPDFKDEEIPLPSLDTELSDKASEIPSVPSLDNDLLKGVSLTSTESLDDVQNTSLPLKSSEQEVQSTTEVPVEEVKEQVVPLKEASKQEFKADVSPHDMSISITKVEDNSITESSLPNFDDEEKISLQRQGEQLSSVSTNIRTESLLLKSIFIEREHYANLLFSLKRVKDDLKKSGPQQRKLTHLDTDLIKEYGKLSTLFENVNENLMVIEHIVSNEQF